MNELSIDYSPIDHLLHSTLQFWKLIYYPFWKRGY